jgi:hypothetical protein
MRKAAAPAPWVLDNLNLELRITKMVRRAPGSGARSPSRFQSIKRGEMPPCERSTASILVPDNFSVKIEQRAVTGNTR